METTNDIQVLSLEKVIETKLVQNNVTDAVLAALKEKYGGMKLASIDDKESYLDIKAAARDCAKVRNLAVKVCKAGREDAVAIQKKWVAKEKEVIAIIDEVESPLDAEIERFDNEVKRKEQEEIERQEAAYIGRQAELTRMGARYEGGCFILGEAEYEAKLIKSADREVWEENVLPHFKKEYEQIEAVRISEEAKKEAAAVELRREQEEMRQQQEQLRLQQEEFRKKQEEVERIEREKRLAEQREAEKKVQEEEFERRRVEMEKAAEEKRLADIAIAIENEQKRIAEEQRLAEIKKQQEEARKAEEMAQASDKVKYADLVSKFSAIELPDMRSGQYRKKVAIIREKLEEILAL